MQYSNYHTHTNFCDGVEEPEKYVLKAIEKNMSSLGFSAHAPLPFETWWNIKIEDIEKYFSVIGDLKNKYSKDLDILSGLEIDYIPGVTESFGRLSAQYKLDYTIGSVHLVSEKKNGKIWNIDGPDKNYVEGLENIFNNDIRDAVGHYYRQIQEMVVNEKPDIIGHIDKIKMNNKNRFFTEEEGWYKKLVRHTLKVIAETNSIVEVNTRGVYKKRTDDFFPGISILEQCKEFGIPVTVNSDAHSPQELIYMFDEAMQTLKDIGFKGIYHLIDGKWKELEMNCEL